MRAFLAGVVPLLLLIPSATIHAKTDVWRRLAWVEEPVTGLALASPGTVFAGTFSGALIRIDSGGQTRIVENFGGGPNPITAIVVDPRDPFMLYVATAQGIFKSVDGGSNWVGLTTEVQGAAAMAVDPQNSNTVFAASKELGLFKSLDGGTTWALSFNDAAVQNVVIDPRDPRIVYAGTALGIAKSADGGTTWASGTGQTSAIRVLAIDLSTPTTLYAGSDNGVVYKTTDSGTTWMDTGLRSTSVFALVVDIQDSDTVYAATESGPYKSTNGGQSWRLLDEGLAGRTLSMIGDLALCKIYIGTDNGALETDIGPVLTIHSNLCIGGEWTVVVSHAGANTPVRLLGTSNGSAWELADWGFTNEAGMVVASGTFANDAAGTHQLQIEVAGVRSNLISFTVTNCGLSQP